MSVRGPWRKHALQHIVDAWRATTGRDDPSVLLLGVTPELCALPTGARSRRLPLDLAVSGRLRGCALAPGIGDYLT